MPAPTALAIPRLHPYVGRDVRWLLEQRMRTHRDRPYIIWDPFEGTGCELTYSEFGAAVARVAGGFVEHGIKAGDFVLIHLGNCPEFLIAWHACARVGAVAVTTNTRSSRDELAYYAANCAAVAAITQPSFVDTVAACLPDARWIAAHRHRSAARRRPRSAQAASCRSIGSWAIPIAFHCADIIPSPTTAFSTRRARRHGRKASSGRMRMSCGARR